MSWNGKNLFREKFPPPRSNRKRKSPENEATANRTFYLPFFLPSFPSRKKKEKKKKTRQTTTANNCRWSYTTEQTTIVTPLSSYYLLLPPPITKKRSARQIPLFYCYGALLFNNQSINPINHYHYHYHYYYYYYYSNLLQAKRGIKATYFDHYLLSIYSLLVSFIILFIDRQIHHQIVYFLLFLFIIREVYLPRIE